MKATHSKMSSAQSTINYYINYKRPFCLKIINSCHLKQGEFKCIKKRNVLLL